jgi:hypothetical protein
MVINEVEVTLLIKSTILVLSVVLFHSGTLIVSKYMHHTLLRKQNELYSFIAPLIVSLFILVLLSLAILSDELLFGFFRPVSIMNYGYLYLGLFILLFILEMIYSKKILNTLNHLFGHAVFPMILIILLSSMNLIRSQVFSVLFLVSMVILIFINYFIEYVYRHTTRKQEVLYEKDII